MASIQRTPSPSIAAALNNGIASDPNGMMFDPHMVHVSYHGGVPHYGGNGIAIPQGNVLQSSLHPLHQQPTSTPGMVYPQSAYPIYYS
jgi:hypothetical protein